jgi:hypothetical protein
MSREGGPQPSPAAPTPPRLPAQIIFDPLLPRQVSENETAPLRNTA